MAVRTTFGLFTCAHYAYRFASWVANLRTKKEIPALPKRGLELTNPDECIAAYQKKTKTVEKKLRELLLSDQAEKGLAILKNLARKHPKGEVFQKLTANCFSYAPAEMLHAWLLLLEKEPTLAEKIILSLAKYVKSESGYDTKSKESRQVLIQTFDRILGNFFQDNALRRFSHELESGESLDAIDDSYILLGDGDVDEEKLEAVRELNGHHERFQEVDGFLKNFWDGCLAFIDSREEFGKLNLYSPDERISGREISFFGDFVERMLYKGYNPQQLCSQGCYKKWAKQVREFIELKEKAVIGTGPSRELDRAPLLEKCFVLFKQQLEKEQFHSLVTKVIEVFYPSGKSPLLAGRRS